MKNMKKYLAMLLAMAMVLGMSVTSFAAGSVTAETQKPTGTGASITIEKLTVGDPTTIKVYKIVELDAANSTWKTTDTAYDQYVKLKDTDGKPLTEGAEIDYAGLKDVVADKTAVIDTTITVTADKPYCVISGLDIGAYLIVANGEKTTYTVMGDKTYDYVNGALTAANETIRAKGQFYQISKTISTTQPDGQTAESKTFVNKGEAVNFDITMQFPSFGEGQKKTFTITDTPTGMRITNIAVKVGENTLIKDTDYTVDKAEPKADEAVTVDLSNYIGGENAHAGQDVVVTVTAVITDDTNYSNTATSNKAVQPTTPQVGGTSGSITIYKWDESGKNGGKALNGAKFSITRKNENSPLRFVETSAADAAVTVYTVVTDDTDMTGKTAVTEVEAKKGIVQVKGLGDGEYKIVETVAPEGYTVVDVPNTTLVAKTYENATVDVVDTRLAELPSTGGVGTTLFTIGGCAIMIIIAGMYFSYRRRTAR